MADRFMHHRLLAIAAIQRALSSHNDSSAPHTALSDESIATVFNLVCTEEILALHASRAPTRPDNNSVRLLLQPDPAQRRAHLAGWNRMLALRGGLARLNGGLQSFVMRWAYVALSCMLMSLYNLPHMYRVSPGSTSNETSFATTRFLPACRSLPRRGLELTYDYPSSSPFLHLGSRMASACRREGMHRDLAAKILTAECLLQDGRAWLRSRGAAYRWSAHDMQNIFSLALGELVRWNFEHEAVVSAAENLVAMALFIFLFLVCDGGRSICNPLPNILPRLARHLRDARARDTLRAAGVDTWVALLLLMAARECADSLAVAAGEGGDGYEGEFERYFQETVEGRGRMVGTFAELKGCLQGCVWTPAMDLRAERVWERVGTGLERGERVVVNERRGDGAGEVESDKSLYYLDGAWLRVEYADGVSSMAEGRVSNM
ncbi:hypothetical protein B0T22DRAFT_373786 [Podospora appendiculata]|uniref:Uncharacterized protein n=1 Tax=Podospora appendiculata TaxID=314037 RepID=A0AAE0XGW0_9PEZI|nr:hypothetical protein B0T22DRAFT_373786 [Podospora appendiculata]